MKRVFISIVASLLLVLTFTLAACGNGVTKRREQVYQIDAPWDLAAERQHQIVLKDVEYTNFYYKAKICGSLFMESNKASDVYEIHEQSINFKQKCGSIWSAKISVEGLGEIDIFAHRLGKNFLADKGEIKCDEITITALEYETYLNINFIFYSNQSYLFLSET